jgi:Skp family chaperone for outer membrane proteins
MNRILTVLTALGAGLAIAPITVAQAPAPAATSAPATPVAMDAKIALINFEQVVLASNEGQQVTATTQKKYEPKKAEIEKLAQEVEAKKKQLVPTMTDEARAKLLREIDVSEKKLNRDAEEAQTAYNAEWQEALAGVAKKIDVVMKKYCADSGFTLLLDVSSQSSNVMWALPKSDISQAVVDMYNKTSGVSAPPPPSPSARPAGPRPAAKPPVK